MNYRTVFDISEVGFKSWDFSASGIIFIVIGILLVFYGNKLPLHTNISKFSLKFRKFFSYFFLGFAILWFVLSFGSTFLDYYSHSQAFKNGDYDIAEGIVTDFVPMPHSGHVQESFCVDGYPCFDYSDYGITAGFNNAKSHGGPIDEDVPVRVSYIGNTILKLEIGVEE